jgi:hypothetical protein
MIARYSGVIHDQVDFSIWFLGTNLLLSTADGTIMSWSYVVGRRAKEPVVEKSKTWSAELFWRM